MTDPTGGAPSPQVPPPPEQAPWSGPPASGGQATGSPDGDGGVVVSSPAEVLARLRDRVARGEGQSDPSFQREVEEWRLADPIDRLEQSLVSAGWFTAETLEAVWDDAARELESAEAFAEQSPYPDSGTALDFVYTDSRS